MASFPSDGTQHRSKLGKSHPGKSTALPALGTRQSSPPEPDQMQVVVK